MEYSSRSVTASPPVFAADGLSPVQSRQTLRAVLWSPLLVLAAMVHVICRPATKKLFLTLGLFNIALQCGSHLNLRMGAAKFGAIEGFDASLTTISLVVLYAGWLLGERAANRSLRTVWSWPIAAYFGAVILSLLVTSDLELSLFQVWLLTEAFLLYLYVAGNVETPEQIEYVVAVLLVGGLLEGLYMILLAVVGHEFAAVRALGIKTVIYLPTEGSGFVRPGGSIGSPNYAAAYLSIIITLAVGLRRVCQQPWVKRLVAPTIAVALAALAVTFSRGGWLQLLLSVTIIAGAYWLRNGISKKAVGAALSAVIMIVLCLYVIPNPISRRLSADDNGSAHSRLPLMRLAARVIVANPILGVGANNFSSVMDHYAGSEFRHEWIYTVHNQFLLVAAETGMLSLAAYLWIIVDLIRRGWRLWQSRHPMFGPLGITVVAAICGFISHMFVDIFNDGGLIQLVWLLIALVGVSEIVLKQGTTKPVPSQPVMDDAQ